MDEEEFPIPPMEDSEEGSRHRAMSNSPADLQVMECSLCLRIFHEKDPLRIPRFLHCGNKRSSPILKYFKNHIGFFL